MAKKEELKKKPSAKAGAVAVAPPKGSLAAMQSKGRGFEEDTQREDLIIPRAKLLQSTSPEIQTPTEGLKVGMIINSLTKEVLPSVFIPIFKFTNWIRFNPRNSKDRGYDAAFGPGDIIWRSQDPYDKRVIEEGKFSDAGDKPLATKFLNFFAYFPGVAMPVIVSFSNSSYKAGKQLLSLAQFSGGDMFAKQYALTAFQDKNDLGTFYVLKVDSKGSPSADDFKVAEAMWTDFHAKEIKVDEGGVNEEVTGEEKRPY